jgi:D-3-phosphoglycerate dehydrogenase
MADRIAVNTDAPLEYFRSSPEGVLLQRAGIDVRGGPCRSEDETIACARDADAILNGIVPITRRVLESLPRTRVVARYGVGVDNVDLDAATEQGIVVVNVPDYCAEEVSNQALAFLLAWARQVTRYDSMLHEGGWGFDHVPSMQSVHQQRLGVIGGGRIGLALARKGLALGMEVVVHDPYLDAAELEKQGVRSASLEELLAASDYVSIHVPLTKQTHHLIGAEQLASMKPTGFLINTSRGPVVDERALIEALQNKKIAGAGLDVFEQEPLPKDNPLRRMPNVILTPHVGAQSPVATSRLRRQIAEEVIRALGGELPLNIANPAVRSSARLLRDRAS